jgi:chromosome segregation ATPase
MHITDTFETTRQRERREAEEAQQRQDKERSAADDRRIARENAEAAKRANARWEIEHLHSEEESVALTAKERQAQLTAARHKAQLLRAALENQTELKAVQAQIEQLELEIVWCNDGIAAAPAACVQRLVEARARLSLWPQRAEVLKQQLQQAEQRVKDLENALDKLARKFGEIQQALARILKGQPTA